MLDYTLDRDKSKVWIINQYAITPDLPGGTRHYDLGCELVKRGYVVRIFASDVNLALRRHTRLDGSELFCDEEVNGVIFTWVSAAEYQQNDWRRVLNMLTFTANVFRVGLRCGERPIAIIGSSPHPFAALAAWFLCKRKRSRFILELRDLWPQALIDMGGMREGSLVVRCLRLLETFLYKVADTIIILATGSRKYLLERGVCFDKIAYIPNGVHLANFCLPDLPSDLDNHLSKSAHCETVADYAISEIRREFGFERFTVVYTGAHGPANALGTVLRAADILRDRVKIDFVLVGDGPSKGYLIREAKRLHLNNLRFMDPIPKGQIPRLLAAADATLISLRAVEAFSYGVSPNKLFDYMAAAKPVICAIPGNMAQLVQDNGAGLAVEPENPQALADAVITAVKMTDYDRATMGQSGRRLVEKEFARERLALRLISIL